MNLSPLRMKRDSEDNKDEEKEEDWEVVVKSKDPNSNAVRSGSEDLNSEQIPEDHQEREIEEWYRTIPATPANTPEYRPVPPSYPSTSLRKTEELKSSEATDLPAIKENPEEEETLNPLDKEEVQHLEYTPDITADEDPFPAFKRLWARVNYNLFQTMLFVIIIQAMSGVVGWAVLAAWRKFKDFRAKPKST